MPLRETPLERVTKTLYSARALVALREELDKQGEGARDNGRKPPEYASRYFTAALNEAAVELTDVAIQDLERLIEQESKALQTEVANG